MARAFALTAAILPALILGGRALFGALGADPVEHALNSLGWTAILLLLASLACTPLHELFRWKWPLVERRTLGLAAFFWALAHVLFYVVIDQGLDLPAIWADVRKRNFILLGASAFLTLLPLAITSTKAWTRRLGFRRWKLLHRLAYLAGVLAGLHYLMRFKLVEIGPILALITVAVLLGVRLAALDKATRAER